MGLEVCRRTAQLVHEPAVDVGESRSREAATALVDPHRQRAAGGMKQTQRAVEAVGIGGHLGGPAAEQQRQPTNLVDPGEGGFVEREGTAERDSAGEGVGMMAGGPQGLRAPGSVAHQPDATRMNREPSRTLSIARHIAAPLRAGCTAT